MLDESLPQVGEKLVDPSTAPATKLAGYPDVLTPAATTGNLLPEHRQMLIAESGISEEAIEARGYFTQTDANALGMLGFAKNQCLPPALVIPLRNFKGETVGYTLRPDIPRNGSNGKPIKYESAANAPAILDIAPLTAADIEDAAKPLIITEGAKKADAAASRGLCAIGLNGVFGFRGRGPKNSFVALPDWESIALKNRPVFVAYDSDVTIKESVQMALQRLCPFLQSRGAVVKVIYLQPGAQGEKTGLDDFFVRGGTVADLFSLARDLEPDSEVKRKKKESKIQEKLEKIQSAGLPTIETNDRQTRDKLIDLSAAFKRYNEKTPSIFHGAGGLVRVELSASGSPQLKQIGLHGVQNLASKAAQWISTREGEGIRQVEPPRDLCAMFLSTPDDWQGIPSIEGTASAPFFAPNGELCATTGYHEAAQTWLHLPPQFKLPDTVPTSEAIQRAKKLLLDDVLGEVAFKDDASRAHALAQMLLPFVRRLVQGATPLHLWTAPLRGSGKSYAAELCILPFTEPKPTPEKASPEEWRKSLLCDLVTGPSHVYLDNIKGSLESPALDMALTSSFMRERMTGTGEMIEAPIRCVFVATANNAQLTEDAVTRAIVIRVDPESENPDLNDFAGDPKKYIRENRAKVCGAIITLVRAWIEAGRPAYSGLHKCRYPEWQTVMGGILEVIGVPGFLDNLQEQREAIGEGVTDDWTEFVLLWAEQFPGQNATAADLLPLAARVPGIAAITDKAGGEAARGRSLMLALRHQRDRVYAGHKITPGPKINRQSSYALTKPGERIHTRHTRHTTSITTRTGQNSLDLITEENELNKPITPIPLYTKDSMSSVSSVQRERKIAEVF